MADTFLTFMATLAVGCTAVGTLYAVIAAWFEGRGKR